MEATATSGAPAPAASPSSTPTPATTADLHAALNGDADSSLPDDGDQDPSEEPEAKAEGEAEPDEKKADDEDKPKDKTARRIEKLLKERDNVRKELATARQQSEREKVRLSLALKTVMGKLSEREAMLAEYGVDLSSSDEKLADIERRQKVQAEYAQHEKKIAEQVEQQQAQQVQDEAKSIVEESLADALEEFPHLTDAQLRAKLAAHAAENPDLVVSDAAELFRKFAGELDEELYSHYEKRALEKHAPRLNAPKPLAGSGTMGVRGSFSSLDDIVADAEGRFGQRFGDKP